MTRIQSDSSPVPPTRTIEDSQMPAASSIFPFSDDPVNFDEQKLGRITPRLGEVRGFRLTTGELETIFGVNPTRFAPLPKRVVSPDLHGEHDAKGWYRCKGWLYQAEPVEWIPVVVSEGTIPAGALRMQSFENKKEAHSLPISSSPFEVNIRGSGSYFDIKVVDKSDAGFIFSNVLDNPSFDESNKAPLHRLSVYPLLRFRLIKRQQINIVIDNENAALKWWDDMGTQSWWEEHAVGKNRLRNLSTDLQPQWKPARWRAFCVDLRRDAPIGDVWFHFAY
jgi:hypothetical protein